MKDNLKVAKTLDDYTVVINAGSEDGIKNGSVVMLYEMGGMIKDPDTGEDLDELEIVKGTGVVTHVQPHIATVESNMMEDEPRRIIRKENPGLVTGLVKMFGTTDVEEIPTRRKPFDYVTKGCQVRVIRE
jgi:hypothetical protein